MQNNITYQQKWRLQELL